MVRVSANVWQLLAVAIIRLRVGAPSLFAQSLMY